MSGGTPADRGRNYFVYMNGHGGPAKTARRLGRGQKLS